MARRRPPHALTALVVGGALLLLTGFSDCLGTPEKKGPGFGPWGVITVKHSPLPSTVTPGQSLTVDFAGTSSQTVFDGEKPCIAAIEASWVDVSTKNASGMSDDGMVAQPRQWRRYSEVVWTAKSRKFEPCGELGSTAVAVKVPKWFVEGWVVFSASSWSRPGMLATSYYYGAAKQVDLKAAAPAAAGEQPPVARIVLVQQPISPSTDGYLASSGQGVADARLSTDPAGGELAYAWDMNEDGVYGDTPTVTGWPWRQKLLGRLDTGMAWLELGPAYDGTRPYPKVSVRVTSKVSGLSDTETVSVRVMHPGSGMVSWGGDCMGPYATQSWAPGGEVDFCLWTPYNTANAGSASIACVDANGDGTFGDPVADHTGTLYVNGQVPLPLQAPADQTGVRVRATAAAASGLQVMNAVIWDATVDAIRDFGCAAPLRSPAHETPGVISQLAIVYPVSTLARSARAGAKRYVASSRLRLTRTTVAASGTRTAGAKVSGLVLRGASALTAPAKGKGVARPSGIAALRSGTYVLRMDGASISGSSAWIGPGTMLIRATDGSLACFAIDGREVDSAMTLAGGTGPFSRLTATLAGPALKMEGAGAGKKRPSALPAQKKPTSLAGGITAVEAKSPRGLTPACTSLKRYLK